MFSGRVSESAPEASEEDKEDVRPKSSSTATAMDLLAMAAGAATSLPSEKKDPPKPKSKPNTPKRAHSDLVSVVAEAAKKADLPRPFKLIKMAKPVARGDRRRPQTVNFNADVDFAIGEALIRSIQLQDTAQLMCPVVPQTPPLPPGWFSFDPYGDIRTTWAMGLGGYIQPPPDLNPQLMALMSDAIQQSAQDQACFATQQQPPSAPALPTSPSSTFHLSNHLPTSAFRLCALPPRRRWCV